MLIVTFLLACLGFFPTDATDNTFVLMLTLNIAVPIGMILLGFMMPWIAKRQADGLNAFGRTAWWIMTVIVAVVLIYLATDGINTSLLAHQSLALRYGVTGIVDVILFGVIMDMTKNGRRGTVA